MFLDIQIKVFAIIKLCLHLFNYLIQMQLPLPLCKNKKKERKVKEEEDQRIVELLASIPIACQIIELIQFMDNY